METIIAVIDMINDFAHKNGSLYCGETVDKIIPNIVDLIKNATKNRSYVYLVNDRHEKGDPEFDLHSEHSVEGTWGSETIEEIQHLRTEYALCSKRTYDAVYNTWFGELLTQIKDKENYQILVTGVCTSICIMETVASIYKLGWRAQIRKDCVADFNQPMHHMALKRMETLFGAIII